MPGQNKVTPRDSICNRLFKCVTSACKYSHIWLQLSMWPSQQKLRPHGWVRHICTSSLVSFNFVGVDVVQSLAFSPTVTCQNFTLCDTVLLWLVGIASTSNMLTLLIFVVFSYLLLKMVSVVQFPMRVYWMSYAACRKKTWWIQAYYYKILFLFRLLFSSCYDWLCLLIL